MKLLKKMALRWLFQSFVQYGGKKWSQLFDIASTFWALSQMRSRAIEDIYKWPIRSLQIPGNYAIFPKLFYGSCRTSILISQNLIFLALPCSSCFQRCLPRLIIAYATNHSLRAPPTDHISNWHIWSSRMPRVWVLILIHFVTTSWYLCKCLRDLGMI